MMDIIKVASNSRTTSVAGSIAHAIRENGHIDAQGIGAGAVNQMLKATIMAKQYLAEEGTELIFSPAFTIVDISGQERTAVRLSIAGVTKNGSLFNEKTVTADV